MDADMQLVAGPGARQDAGERGPDPISILIADDHPLFREGLRRALDLAAGLTVVGEAADGEACLEAAVRLRPQVILVDLSMPGPGGTEVVRRLKEIHPDGRVVVLTIHDGEQDLLDAVRAGADGYILKDVEPSELIRAIRACWRGERYLHQGLGGKLMQGLERIATTISGGPQTVLSEREWAVLQLLAEGCSNRDVGSRLFISEKTVKNHASSLFRKLGARDRTQAVVEAVKRGWIRLG
jgi:two-component system response regulator DegU